MAAGSAAASRQRLLDAGYWTGASSANSQPRCGCCRHVAPSPRMIGGTKYDRLCKLHDASCKTHGCCRRFEAPDSEPK